MKTINASLHQPRQVQSLSTGNVIPAMAASAQELLALLSAVALAATIVMLSVWAAGMEMTNILGAGIWGIGFIFFGLAVDSIEPKAILHLVTGVALLVLAWLQANVSADYVIMSGVLVASWVAVSVYQRLR